MLNPDGVIVGNYRCSLAGRDLNRNYKTGLRDSFPSVWHTRKMVERYHGIHAGKCAQTWIYRENCLQRTGLNLILSFLMCLFSRLVNETDVVMYCDFHGHNRKNNVFMYGCNTRGDNSLKLQERVFPLMMSKNASNKVELF